MTLVRGAQLASPLELLGAIREHGRTTDSGLWIPVAYDAANFLADVGTWAVDSGDQIAYAYKLHGLSMLLAWNIAFTNVSNAGALLRLVVPGGFTIGGVGTITALTRSSDAGAATVVGASRATAGTTYVEMRSTISGLGYALTAGNNTQTAGAIEFPLAA